MSRLTTHVLDTSRGKPASGIAVIIERAQGANSWQEVARGVTNSDGRVSEFAPPIPSLEVSVYRIRFSTGAYFAALGLRAFYPVVEVSFQIDDPSQHYHVPLLLSPFGYSTYRGS
jgi:5-hydroxyisourate hydrolase